MGSYKNALSGVMAAFVILNAIVLLARVYVRAYLVKAFGLDDLFLMLSYVGFVIACGFGWTSMYYGFAADLGDVQPWFNTAKLMKAYFVNQMVLYISSGLVKIAVSLVLYRLAPNLRSQAILITSIVVAIVWTAITTVFASDMCANQGSANYAGSGVCTGVGYFRMVSEIVFDYFLALYPIPMLWRSSLSDRMKLIVCGLLSLGLIASAATIAKLIVLVRMTQTDVAYEVSWYHYQLLMWADIELGLSIFAAACAGLRPLVRRMLGRTQTKSSTVNRAPPRLHISIGPLPRGPTARNLATSAGGESIHKSHHVSADEYELMSVNTRTRAGGYKFIDEEQGHQLPPLSFNRAESAAA